MRPCQQCGAAIQMREAVCSACESEQVATIGVRMNSNSIESSEASQNNIQSPEQELFQGTRFVLNIFIAVYTAIAIVSMVFAIRTGEWKEFLLVGALAFFVFWEIAPIYYSLLGEKREAKPGRSATATRIRITTAEEKLTRSSEIAINWIFSIYFALAITGLVLVYLDIGLLGLALAIILTLKGFSFLLNLT